MKRCSVCKLTSDETEIYEGILDNGMVLVCGKCAENEKIPIIKKPSNEQLNKADHKPSVRERMERLSGRRDSTEISNDQMAIQGNIAKLRAPEPKQSNDAVIDNYDWKISMARRRKKLSIGQISSTTQIPREILQGLERGKLPENFQEVLLKLESFLGISLLKNHQMDINFKRNINAEKEILKKVRERMDNSIEKVSDGEVTDSEISDIKKREEKIDRINKGRLDFSKRESLNDITLNDLVEIKKEREDKEREIRIKKQNESMFGDDLEFEED